MSYQDAIERVIALRLCAKKENDAARREALLRLAGEWETWAETCREGMEKGIDPNPAGRPAEDI